MKSSDRNYYPIRRKATWIAIIQAAAALAAIVGVQFDVEVWVKWLIGVLDILVLTGVLIKGTRDAEKQTTPVDQMTGEPLNPEYTKNVAA